MIKSLSKNIMQPNKEKRFLIITLSLIFTIIVIDLINDSIEGVVWWHIMVEGSAGLLALGGIFYLLKDSIQLRRDLTNAKVRERELTEQAERWRNQSKSYIDGLAAMISEQLLAWNLTPAECEVAFLLLKGMSQKEIADIRGTTEKTARVQSMAIYAKGGLKGRSELSAFFLEDLLPSANAGSKEA